MSAKKKTRPKVARPANPVSHEERIRILEKRIEELERKPYTITPYYVPHYPPTPTTVPHWPWPNGPFISTPGVVPSVHPTVTW
jgi:hypothetical protein